VTDAHAPGHDPAHLAARLAAIERALSARSPDCDCPHEGFEPPAASDRSPTHDADLHAAVVELAEYALDREGGRENTDRDEWEAKAVHEALASLDAELTAGRSDPQLSVELPADPTPTPDAPLDPRAWLCRVARSTSE